MLKRVYVWEFPVRLSHWVNFLAILALSISGYYIGAPFIQAIRDNQFIMAKFRFIHFVAAYFFAMAVLLRFYWWLVGNRYARWNQFLPVSSERVKSCVDTTAFYCFMRERLPDYAGHTGLAGLTYLFVFMLFVVQIFTGFALYSQSHVGALWTVLGGWVFAIINQGTVRLIHHCIMWIIAIFLVIHIYISWHNDMVEKDGLVSSIFSGYKTKGH